MKAKFYFEKINPKKMQNRFSCASVCVVYAQVNRALCAWAREYRTRTMGDLMTKQLRNIYCNVVYGIHRYRNIQESTQSNDTLSSRKKKVGLVRANVEVRSVTPLSKNTIFCEILCSYMCSSRHRK